MVANLKPHISVIIPCYNAARFIGETLESVLRQTHQPEEVIVVDDGSTDESARIAQTYGPLVRVIRQENQGESVARNRGIDEAQGDWVAFLDADDVWDSAMLEKLCAAANDTQRNFCCIYSNFDYLIDGKRVEAQPLPSLQPNIDPNVQFLCNFMVPIGTALVRTTAAKATRFPDDIVDSEDMVFFLKLHDLGPFLRIPEPLLLYRRSIGQQTRRTDYMVRSVRARANWLDHNLHRFTIEAATDARRRLAALLVDSHDAAYWRRDHATVHKCRQLFRELEPNCDALPESFHRRIFPTWLMKAKDGLDRVLSTVKPKSNSGVV